MKVLSSLRDHRISSTNFLVEITVDEYLQFAKDILEKNEYQRRRVRASKTVYSLLKKDIQKGCIMPPLVLAITSQMKDGEPKLEEFEDFLNANKDHLIILDGLQRTYSIVDLINEVLNRKDEDSLKTILSHPIRAEFYVGLNRLGILYRMLTLNTGQTPMSLRQQIEILYLDYSHVSINGIELIREADGKKASAPNQYNFRDIVEGFNSYLERNELPIDRANILENIKSLENLALENQEIDIFENYLKSWNSFMSALMKYGKDTEISAELLEDISAPFGENLIQVFKKPQAMSGFGAAVGKLKDFELVNDFDQAIKIIEEIVIEDPLNLLESINRHLDWIKNNTKKIGNAQRSYFQYYFREILNPENENYKNTERATDSALRKYQSQNM